MIEWLSLLLYLQKNHWISRDEFEQMIKSNAILINDLNVSNFKTNIKIWDNLKIIENWKTIFEKKIEQIKNIPTKIVLFNKPKWLVVSKDDKYNKTIFEILPKSWKKDFYYVGRLDKDSRWLLLLVNSPWLVDYYENPKSNFFKVYEVKINKKFEMKHLSKMQKWLDVSENWNAEIEEWEPYDFLSVHKISIKNDKQNIITVVLTEWKKRHIRRILNVFWYKVIDLNRIKFWKYSLWSIKEWKYRIYDYKKHF